MQTLTVSRHDEIYEAFADVAQAADGTLVCTYRESMGHSSRPFSRIIVRRSFDRGLTWGPRQVVLERTEEIVEIEKQVRADMRRGISPLQGLNEHGHI